MKEPRAECLHCGKDITNQKKHSCKKGRDFHAFLKFHEENLNKKRMEIGQKIADKTGHFTFKGLIDYLAEKELKEEFKEEK